MVAIPVLTIACTGTAVMRALCVIKDMAKEYYEKLSTPLEELNLKNEISSTMEVKHFFSGAALYVNKAICASWSPVGLAFKSPEQEAAKLINNGKAIPLKYFHKDHVKKRVCAIRKTR